LPPQFGAWYQFESLVANLFRVLKARRVSQNIGLAGHQIDIYIEEETPTGQILRTAVEAKFYQRPVGKDVVTRFALITDFLRKANLIDRGMLVSLNGFTKEASLSAKEFEIELLKFEDLESQAGRYRSVNAFIEKAEKMSPPKPKKDLIFVLMPFVAELEDLYIYGIRRAAERAGYVCLRADEIEHNSDIMDQIIYNIQNATVVIAETTDKNPNVFYEIGFAHGKGQQVILLAKKGSDIAFDLKSKNHIIYDNIHDLEEKLVKRLEALGK
jgi:hypothetical protein